MRIDKIEICNIASIEGEQQIDFTQEPLKSAGLFAITGKTGAGKSTVLDAVCVPSMTAEPTTRLAASALETITRVTPVSATVGFMCTS